MTVYNMPIWLRNATSKFILDFYQKQNSKQEEGLDGAAKEEAKKMKKIEVPSYQNVNYTTKASKK
jgi:hypothetical protein